MTMFKKEIARINFGGGGGSSGGSGGVAGVSSIAGNTGAVPASTIKSVYESTPDTNAFTDALLENVKAIVPPILTDTTFVVGAGGDFATAQEAIDTLSSVGISSSARVTLSSVGDIGGFTLHKSLSNVHFEGATRAALALSDFTSAATPDWSSADNDTGIASTNTLFIATKAAIEAMLLGKYTTHMGADAETCIELNGHNFGSIKNILVYNRSNSRRGISTGSATITGSGGNVQLIDSSVHGFAESNLVTNYGGTFLATLSGGSGNTFSCAGGTSFQCQYSGTFYVQDTICYANFNWGGRVKQNGIIYSGRSLIHYNRLDGLATTEGGELNAENGDIQHNGGFGINASGASVMARSAKVRNNLSGGIRSQDSSDVNATTSDVGANGGIGLYALNASIRAPSATIDGNASHNVAVIDNGTVIATNSTISNAVNGQGVRIDLMGYVSIAGASVFGNVSAFSSQVLVSRGGIVHAPGATDATGSPLLDADFSPRPNILTHQGVRISTTTANDTDDVTGYTMENVIGPVGEVSGVPTGALFNTGSNGNGTYVQYADGTQICRHQLLTDATGAVVWTYPEAFVNTASSHSFAANSGAPVFATVQTPTATTVNVHGWNANGARVGVFVQVTAVGRWF